MEANKKAWKHGAKDSRILLNSASRKPGDRTFPPENSSNPENSRKVRTAKHGFSNTLLVIADSVGCSFHCQHEGQPTGC